MGVGAPWTLQVETRLNRSEFLSAQSNNDGEYRQGKECRQIHRSAARRGAARRLSARYNRKVNLLTHQLESLVCCCCGIDADNFGRGGRQPHRMPRRVVPSATRNSPGDPQRPLRHSAPPAQGQALLGNIQRDALRRSWLVRTEPWVDMLSPKPKKAP